MARAATDRLKFNPPLGRMPVLQFCAPAELQIDRSYQRGLAEDKSVALIRRITQHWNWDQCLPLVVARRANGALFVIDGQHRLEAARLRGDIPHLPCVVGDYASVSDEAATFVHLNQERVALTKLALFRAAVASGDSRALAITEALSAAGLTLAPHSNFRSWQPGMVSHIGGIERTWERQGPPVVKLALNALAQGFAGQVQQYAGSIYRGIAAVCGAELRQSGEFDGARFEQFVTLLQSRGQPEWMVAVKRYFGQSGGLFMAEAVEGLFRQEWQRFSGPVAQPKPGLPRPSAAAPPPPVKREGFGLGAGDWAGDAAWAWCPQCDARRTRAQALACRSGLCPVRKVA